jgi:uncharacterized protein YbjQ (UPF0145 family)
MSIICAVCGKKQSGFIMDFPLTNELNSFRICATCEDMKNRFVKYASEKNGEAYAETHKYFENIIGQQRLSVEVNKYLHELIRSCDEEYEIKKQEELDIINLQKLKISDDELVNNFMSTTGFNFEGYKIKEYNKVICADVVLGTGFLSEFTASFADFFGVESQKFASKLDKARNIATVKLITKALDLNANAIIGLDFDYTMFKNNLLAVIVNGTAVTVEKYT